MKGLERGQATTTATTASPGEESGLCRTMCVNPSMLGVVSPAPVQRLGRGREVLSREHPFYR